MNYYFYRLQSDRPLSVYHLVTIIWFLQVSVRKGDPALFSETFAMHDDSNLWPFQLFTFAFLFLTPGIFTTRGINKNNNINKGIKMHNCFVLICMWHLQYYAYSAGVRLCLTKFIHLRHHLLLIILHGGPKKWDVICFITHVLETQESSCIISVNDQYNWPRLFTYLFSNFFSLRAKITQISRGCLIMWMMKQSGVIFWATLCSLYTLISYDWVYTDIRWRHGPSKLFARIWWKLFGCSTFVSMGSSSERPCIR